MSYIATPAEIEDAPEASRPTLRSVEKQLGQVPNMFRLVATSPAALDAYVGLSGALGKGKLSAATRERIALAVAQANSCDYCLAAHSFIGKNLAKLSDEEISASRNGTSSDTKAAAAVRLAKRLAEARGAVDKADLDAVRAAGYDDAEIVEIIAHVALNTLTNYVNVALGTELDFPAAGPLAA